MTMELKTLLHLIKREQVEIATLADAIEKNGIYGWDRFGRYKKFDAKCTGHDGAKYQAVLDRLAEQYQWSSDDIPDMERQSPVEEAEDFPDYSSVLYWGWPSELVPDFASIAQKAADNPAPPKRNRSNPKGDNHSMRLVGALLEIIDGTILESKHPRFKSSQNLAQILEEKYGRRIGSAESLAKKFTDARQALHDRLANT